MSLSGLSKDLAQGEVPLVEVPIWQFLGIEDTPETQERRDQATLWWRRPSVAAMGYVKDAVGDLARQHPLWKPELLYHCALMAQCHVKQSRDDMAPRPFYEGIIEGPHANDELWWWLLNRLTRAFPLLVLPDQLAAVCALDNDFARQIGVDGTTGMRLEAVMRVGQLTLTYLRRWVGECEDIPAEVIADMDALEQGRATEARALGEFLGSVLTKDR